MSTRRFLSFAVSLIVGLVSMISYAGARSAGGPINMYNDAVCTSTDLDFQVQVAKENTSQQHLVTIYAKTNSDPTIVKKLWAKRVFTEQVGAHATYVGEEGFYLNVRIDEILPGGAGRAGSFSFTLGNHHIAKSARCPYFPR